MKTYMEEVAKLLNIAMEEEFQIQYEFGRKVEAHYKLTKEGLKCFDETEEIWETAPEVLSDLLLGDCKIIRLPWLPKVKKPYWYITSSTMIANWKNWCGDFADLLRYSCGNCYQTKMEAEAHKDELIREISANYFSAHKKLNAGLCQKKGDEADVRAEIRESV